MNAALATRPLADLLTGDAGGPVPALAVTDLTLDSRAVTPGALFLATRGSRGHGLAHAAEAVRRGAVAVAWEPGAGTTAPELGVPMIPVENLGRAAGSIAARFWRQPAKSLAITGITGTDGKTSTAHLLAQALDALGQPCAYFGTLGYGRLGRLREASHTTPDAVRLQALLAAERDAGTQAVAMEVSSHALDQARVGGIEFRCAALTNLGRDHLDYHGDVANYAAAKRRLFTEYASDLRVLNRDDATGAQWARELAGGHTLVYGIEGPGEDHSLIARAVQPHAAGLRFHVEHRGVTVETAAIDSPLLGRFNVYNLLAALGALLGHGVPLAEAARALSAARTVPGRIEAFRSADPARPLVVVDYAHTPQALENVLTALRAHCAGKLVCVFGAGGDRDQGKRPLMGAAVARLADVGIVTDDNPRSEDPRAIVDAILAGARVEARKPQAVDGEQLRVIHDRAEAIRTAMETAREGDIVLVAGKGHETTQTVGNEVREFSDRAFVAGMLGLPFGPGGCA